MEENSEAIVELKSAYIFLKVWIVYFISDFDPQQIFEGTYSFIAS